MLGIGAVGAADRLQQGVVAQRLVEVHRLQDRRVEAGQQLGGDDEDLQRVVGVAEAVEQRLLLVLGRARSASATRADRSARRVITTALASSGRMLVERLLVEDARLAVVDDDLRLEAVRLDVLLEVLRRCRRRSRRAARAP